MRTHRMFSPGCRGQATSRLNLVSEATILPELPNVEGIEVAIDFDGFCQLGYEPFDLTHGDLL